MQIEYLNYFIRVADMGNVTLAAEHLNISQPQLSRIITNLEREVGVKLLERNAKGAALTESGQAFYLSAKKVLESCEEGVRQARQASSAAFIRFVLGSTIDFYLSGFVKHLLGDMPNAVVKQVYGQRGELAERLLSHNIGSVVSAPIMDASPRLQSQLLFEDKLVVVHPDGHEFSGRPHVAISDLQEERLVLHTAGYGIRPMLDLAERAAGVTWRNLVVETSDTTALLDYVRSGVGVSVVPAAFAHHDAFCASHTVPFDREIPLPIAVTWIRDRPLRAADYRYKEIIAEYFSMLG